MKKSFITLAVILASIVSCVAQQAVSYTITGLKDGKAYLSAVHGGRHDPVDSCHTLNGLIEFKNTAALPAGVYRISFEDSLFTDIIMNNEAVTMSNNMDNLLDSLKVLSSEENKIYYHYWRMSTYINDTIDMISDLGNKIYEENGHVLTPDLDSMARKTRDLSAKLDNFTNQLITRNPGLYVSKLLKAYVSPDWSAYKKTAGAKSYKSKHLFLKEHYFDHIDFSDSTLLNSEVFYVLCNDYLSRFAEPETDSTYIAAIDFILNKTQQNSPVYNYILNLFVSTFDDTEWEETFIHLVDNYLSKNTCTPSEYDKNMAERAAVLKTLKPGNKAPGIVLNDIDGKPKDLYALQAKVTLLMFWSSQCEHCEKVMPQIQNIYSVYHPSGLEIFAVSADTDKKAWTDAVTKHGLKWINVSDLKGFQSPVIISYNAYSTPTFFLLDKEKNIISHPYSPKEMSERLQKAFGK